MGMSLEQLEDIKDYVISQSMDSKHIRYDIDRTQDGTYNLTIQLHRKSQDNPDQLLAVAEVYARQKFDFTDELPVQIKQSGQERGQNTPKI